MGIPKAIAAKEGSILNVGKAFPLGLMAARGWGWVTNPNDHAVDVQFQLLQSGQANIYPITVTDTLSAGQTKTYENLIDTLFHRSDVLGAVRVRSSDRVLVSSRIFSQAA